MYIKPELWKHMFYVLYLTNWGGGGGQDSIV